jgi:hypothetical protein
MIFRRAQENARATCGSHIYDALQLHASNVLLQIKRDDDSERAGSRFEGKRT